MASSAVAAEEYQPTKKEIRLVIAASSVGTVFEWYDFFIYGTLAAIIGATFFPSENETLRLLLALAGFAVGFGFRPLGAILFGFLGDRLGRKYTFLVTITLMGLATAAIGFLPSAANIGLAAPVILILLRILQGLALGGEYGGAAIYVAEHAPEEKRGFYTSFIQASVAGGFVLSIVVVLTTQALVGEEAWLASWWRFPFLFSLLLLVVSLWMRLKLKESPVFKKMKSEGTIAANPFKESFTYPGNKRRIFVALFGVTAGLTVIWYTAMFSGLFFLQGAMRVEPVAAQIIVGIGALFGLGWYVLIGWLSDRVGRKKPIVIGNLLTLILLFPIFWLMGSAANPGIDAASERAPIVVAAGPGVDCGFNPFADLQQSECGKVLDALSTRQLPYSKVENDVVEGVAVTVGGTPVDALDGAGFEAALADAGYDLGRVVPTPLGIAKILFAILVLTFLSGLTYGSVAALLPEMFPARIRYSSMSIPYHIGAGYFGGFLPVISQYIIASTGDPYAGLWYTWVIVLMALVVTAFMLPETLGREVAHKG
ncbi:MAG: MFS transporter [Parasphingopyxis sp.]